MTAEKCPTCGTLCRVESKPYLVPIPGGNGGTVPNGNIDHYEPLPDEDITALERAVVEARVEAYHQEHAWIAQRTEGNAWPSATALRRAENADERAVAALLAARAAKRDTDDR